jgi:hypothetical protein
VSVENERTPEEKRIGQLQAQTARPHELGDLKAHVICNVRRG